MTDDEGGVSPATYRRIDAWLFDLDGVLTDTARVHAEAWKATFDEFLARRDAKGGGSFQPFDAVDDYERYVDGKPRYDGVRDFLASRGITLAEGHPSDGSDQETVCGVGNRKNALVLDHLAGHVTVFPGSVTLVEHVRGAGRRTAVVSASENCKAVLATAGIAELFDVIVDGVVARQLHLDGKPAPATYLFAASELGVEPTRAAVVEDATAGVAAGRAGNFGLVVGVARRTSAGALLHAGADVVVGDLNELLDDVVEP